MKWSRRRSHLAPGLAALITLASPAASTAEQLFRLGDWEGALETVTEYSSQKTKTAGADSSWFRDVLNQQRFSLRNAGASIYDPRFITLSLGGTVGLSQESMNANGDGSARQGTLLSYDVFAAVLPDKPFALNLFANRNQSLLQGGIPGRAEVTTENRGATLFARRLYIPSSLSFRQERQEEQSNAAGIESRRSDRRNIVTYEGQRGWLDSEASLRYEFIDHTDEILPELSYQSHEGSQYYSLDFGPDLNRRWDSRVRFLSRTGMAELTTLTLDELLRIDHSERLQTDYRYYLLRLDGLGGTSTGHTAAFNLQHRLYESLTTRAGLDGIFQTLPGGQRNDYRARLDFLYTKRIPWDGRLNMGLGGALQYSDSRFRTPESSVAEEPHTYTPPQQIFLQNPFAAAATIVVRKTAGPVPPGCPPLLAPLDVNIDYRLLTIGDVTEIQPVIVPISPRIATCINPGDVIAVDYKFSVSPSLTYTTASWHFDLGADYRWIRPYYIHEQTDQTLLKGQDGRFLDNQRSDTVGAELRYDGQRLRASWLGEARRYASQRIAYDMLRSNQFLYYSILPELILTASADQSWSFFSRPERDTQSLAGRVTLDYGLNASLFVTVFAGVRSLRDSSVPSERIAEAGLSLRWSYRRVEVLPSLEFIDRRRGDTDTKDVRAVLRVIRRF